MTVTRNGAQIARMLLSLTTAAIGAAFWTHEAMAQSPREGQTALREYARTLLSLPAIIYDGRPTERGSSSGTRRFIQDFPPPAAMTTTDRRIVLAGVLLGIIDHAWLERVSKTKADSDVLLVQRLTDEHKRFDDRHVPQLLATRHTWDVFDLVLALAWAKRATGAALNVRLGLLAKVRLNAPGTRFEELAWQQSVTLAKGRENVSTRWELIDRYTARFPKSEVRNQVCRDAIDDILNTAPSNEVIELLQPSGKRRANSPQHVSLRLLLAERALRAGRFAIADVALQSVAAAQDDTSKAAQQYRFFRMALSAATAPKTEAPHVFNRLPTDDLPEDLVQQVERVLGARSRLLADAKSSAPTQKAGNSVQFSMVRIQQSASRSMEQAMEAVREVGYD